MKHYKWGKNACLHIGQAITKVICKSHFSYQMVNSPLQIAVESQLYLCEKLFDQSYETFKLLYKILRNCPLHCGLCLGCSVMYSLMEHMYLDNWILHLKEHNRKKEPVIVAWSKLPNRETSTQGTILSYQGFWVLEYAYLFIWHFSYQIY